MELRRHNIVFLDMSMTGSKFGIVEIRAVWRGVLGCSIGKDPKSGIVLNVASSRSELFRSSRNDKRSHTDQTASHKLKVSRDKTSCTHMTRCLPKEGPKIFKSLFQLCFAQIRWCFCTLGATNTCCRCSSLEPAMIFSVFSCYIPKSTHPDYQSQ